MAESAMAMWGPCGQRASAIKRHGSLPGPRARHSGAFLGRAWAAQPSQRGRHGRGHRAADGPHGIQVEGVQVGEGRRRCLGPLQGRVVTD